MIFEMGKEDKLMANYQYMMSADDVAKELSCSKSHAYKLVKLMNKELESQGYITMAGRVPRAYLAKKMYGCDLAAN
jgi:predicted transcriptional regulator